MKVIREKNSTIVYPALAAVFSLLMVWALPAMFCVQGDGLWYTNSILALLLWLLLTGLFYRVLQYGFEGKKQKWLILGVFGLLFSICMVFGASLEKKGSVAYTSLALWGSILVLTIGVALLTRYAFEQLAFVLQQKKEEPVCSSTFDIRSFFIRMGVILVCYFPVFLAVYPGFFVYDVQTELTEVITRNFTTHFPLSHVLFMGGIIQLVYKISGSYNLGIACYTIVQMIILSGIFSFVIGLLQKEGAGKRGRTVLTLYFGLCPVIVMFSLCATKDGLFMGVLLLQVMMLRKLTEDVATFFQKKIHVTLFILASLGMMLLRHNGFYAFIVFSVLLLWLGKKAGIGMHRKNTVLLLAGIVVGYLLINQGLIRLLHATDSGSQELLTVPIQQMARVHQIAGDSLSEEDKETLYEILPEEVLEQYTPKLSDGVKYHFNNEAYHADSGKYLKLWIKLGIEHPFTYLNAWFMTSYGFWYPDTVIDVYRGNRVFTFTYEDSSYFGYEVEAPGIRESKLPVLDEFYRKLSLEITQQKIPVVSMLFSPGFLFWVMAFLLCFLWYVGRIKRVVPYLLVGIVWLTFLLGPTYLVRYVVYLWCLVPVLIHDVRFDNWK